MVKPYGNPIKVRALKSDKQRILERNGCVFRGQERLDKHELDPDKRCYCGRPNKQGD